ncbi:MAG: UDP-N-acetylmuramate dehydrogenase [Ilumatobacteraceae bacterium]|mgnify:FL=1|nr:UDP-N-acetylmuramate dehydrogenase [Ilumatobacteraceae bacterium]
MIAEFGRPSDKDLSRLAALLGDRVTKDELIGPYTTYRVGGAASLFMRAMSVDDLHAASRALAKVKIPVLMLGRGSNMLISNSGFRGLAIALGPFAEQIAMPNPDQDPIVVVGAMTSLPVIARQSVAAGLRGFEWAVGVPGSIGGAVRMNAGGHGSDMIASLLSVRLFHIERGIEANVSAANLGLRFRGSDLNDQHIVLSATLRLARGDKAEGESRLAEIVKWRRENQPGGQNAGSVFVNPVSGASSAGALIDGLGLRGYRIGTAEISEKHANFIQADEDGNADDVVELMTFVRQRVAEAHGIELRSEIRLVGFSAAISQQAGAVEQGEVSRNTQLESAFGSSNNTDLSIPVPSFSEQLSDEVLAELKDAFDGDATPTANLRVVLPEDPDKSQQESRDQTRDKSSTTNTSLTLKTNNGRIVIVDEDLRLPVDSDHPIDEMTSSVNIAPTSDPSNIIRDSRIEDRHKNVFNTLASNRRRLLTAAGSVIGVVALVLIVLASPIIGVRKIEIEGARYVSADLLIAVEKSLDGKSILTVDTRAAERRLEGDPWVESVRIRSFFPSRLVVEIVERKPVAFYIGVDNRSRVVDSQGRVLAVETGQPTQYLQITGVGPNLAPGASAGTVYRAAAQLAAGMPDELSDRVLNVGVGGPNQLIMTLRTGTLVNFGPPVDLQNKLISLLVLLRRQDAKQILAIDLTDPRTPTVKSK